MLASQAPAAFVAPFANAAGAGFIRTIPAASQIGITAGAASLHDGFPPVCFVPVAAGGTPPWGQDTNGLLNQVTAGVQWSQVGGEPSYNSAFSTAIGGYPSGAILQSGDGTGFWRSTVDNNTSDPDTGGANWLPMFFSTSAPIALTNANVTLSAIQYSKPIIILTGALTAPVALTFPAITQQWSVINATTGSFQVTALVSGGAPVVLTQGYRSSLRGNGTNVSIDSINVSAVNATGSVAAAGGFSVPNNVAYGLTSTTTAFPAMVCTPANVVNVGTPTIPFNILGANGGNVFGIGQTQQTVTRTYNTTYTNSTNAPIMASVATAATATGGSVGGYISGVEFTNSTAYTSGVALCAWIIVPPGSTYGWFTTGSVSGTATFTEIR